MKPVLIVLLTIFLIVTLSFLAMGWLVPDRTAIFKTFQPKPLPPGEHEPKVIVVLLNGGFLRTVLEFKEPNYYNFVDRDNYNVKLVFGPDQYRFYPTMITIHTPNKTRALQRIFKTPICSAVD